MRAAGECQQHERAGKIKASVTCHARDNASSFFNEASTLTLWDCVKDNDLCVPESGFSRTEDSRCPVPNRLIGNLYCKGDAIFDLGTGGAALLCGTGHLISSIATLKARNEHAISRDSWSL